MKGKSLDTEMVVKNEPRKRYFKTMFKINILTNPISLFIVFLAILGIVSAVKKNQAFNDEGGKKSQTKRKFRPAPHSTLVA